MAGLLRGEAGAERNTVYALYKDTQRMVKDGRYKLIRYRKSGVTGEGTDMVQLFDLLEDPGSCAIWRRSQGCSSISAAWTRRCRRG